jgi:hypothetical protein
MDKIKKDIAIAVCYYLPDNYIKNNSCIPIQLGYDETNIDMGIQKDNTDDNRSNKHFLYSEYTGVYWLWKNVDANYKGMLHHRRFLTLQNKSITYHFIRQIKNTYKRLQSFIIPKPFGYNDIISCNDDRKYNEMSNDFCNELNNIFASGYQIIVPKPIHYYITTVKKHFSEVIGINIINAIANTINKNKPNYYYYFIKSINGCILYYGNLEIMKNDIFNEYCEFVFTIFDELEKNIIISNYYNDPMNEKIIYRHFGYIGEMLTNAFILKVKEEKYEIKECTMLFSSIKNGNENADHTDIK